MHTRHAACHVPALLGLEQITVWFRPATLTMLPVIPTYFKSTQAAKARWEQIIKVDVPDFVNTRNLDLSVGQYPGYTNTQRNVDDIVIM
jgi:hypothetical protein